MTTNYRSHQLTYCSTCKNRTFSSTKGVVCGLTNEPATFQYECSDYHEDVARKQAVDAQRIQGIKDERTNANRIIYESIGALVVFVALYLFTNNAEVSAAIFVWPTIRLIIAVREKPADPDKDVEI